MDWLIGSNCNDRHWERPVVSSIAQLMLIAHRLNLTCQCTSWRPVRKYIALSPLQWRHNERGGVSNDQRLECLLKRLFMRRSKKTSKLRVTGLCEGNSSGTGEFPAQRDSNVEYVSIWWRHHDVWIPVPIRNPQQYSKSLLVKSRTVNLSSVQVTKPAFRQWKIKENNNLS